MDALMQLLELPARGLGWTDAQLALVMPDGARLVLWSAVAGLGTMLLYALLSPQRRIAQARQELAAAQSALDRFDGEFAGALPLMRHMFAVALRQLGLVLGPALGALLPTIVLVSWIAHTYGYDFPEHAQPVAVQTAPAQLPARWIAPDTQAQAPRVALDAEDGRPIAEVEVRAPVPVIEKRSWWSALGGNPLGILPDSFPVQRIEIDLPRREYLAFGPNWARHWEFPFFVVLTVVALALRRALRIH